MGWPRAFCRGYDGNPRGGAGGLRAMALTSMSRRWEDRWPVGTVPALAGDRDRVRAVRTGRALIVTGLLASLGACQNYRDQLDRADVHYRAARYESALTNLEDLESDFGHLDAIEQVRYRYVRGMTAERLGQRDEARHWLSLAREGVEQRPAALDEETRAILQRTLLPYDQAAGASVNPPAGAPPTAPAGQSASTRSEPRTTP